MKNLTAPCLVLLLFTLTPSFCWAGVANLSLIPYPYALGNYLYVPQESLGGASYGKTIGTVNVESDSIREERLDYDLIGIGYDLSINGDFLAIGFNSSEGRDLVTDDYDREISGITYQMDEQSFYRVTESSLGALFAQNLGDESFIYVALDYNRTSFYYKEENLRLYQGEIVESITFEGEASNSWFSPIIGFSTGSNIRFGVKIKPATSVSSNFSGSSTSEFKSGNGQELTMGIGLQEENYQIELDRLEYSPNESSWSYGVTGWDLNGQFMLTTDSLLEASWIDVDNNHHNGEYSSTKQATALAGVINFSSLIIKAEAKLEKHTNDYNSKVSYSSVILSLAGSF